jgi:hypothetical protein
LFPKNDFAAFYESGISAEDGLFHYELADYNLIYSVDHPDPSDPLHKWCVEDGRGWLDPNGGPNALHLFVACSNYRTVWTSPIRGIQNLARAYALTGQPVYAHKCLVLLDRLADVYPDLNGRTGQIINFAPGDYWDGIIGPNYWASGWAGLALTYDMIYDGIEDVPEALEFIRGKSRRYKVPSPKKTSGDVKRHIEQRIFVDRFSKRPSYQMNGTISEMCEAKVDLVLRGQEAIDEFATVHMPRIVPPRFLNEDGSGNERSVGYDHGAFGNYSQLLVDLYNLDRVLAKKVLEGYPKFRAVFDFWPDIWCIDGYIPNIGDSADQPAYRTGIPCSPAPYIILYDLTGNARYAQAALLAVEGDLSKIPRNIYSPNPEGIFEGAHQAYREAGEWHTPSLVKRDYRLAILRTGEGEDQLAAWLFYSPHAGTSSHSHFDALNFSLFAHGLPLLAEQGYPLFTGGWPSRWEWTSHTRSHATVTVDGGNQNHCDGGTLLGFAGENGVQMISAEAPCTYDAASVYRRTLVFVDAGPEERFLVDVFRVEGGRQHIYTIPFYYGEMECTGIELAPQPDFYDGYVEEVQAGPMTTAWTVDTSIRRGWEGTPAAHLRVHGGPMEGILMLGQGETRLGDERPERLPYVFLKRDREGNDLASLFVLVYEPYEQGPFLPSQPLTVETGDGSVDVTVEAAGGESFRFEVRDGGPGGTSVTVARMPDGTPVPFTLSGTGEWTP